MRQGENGGRLQGRRKDKEKTFCFFFVVDFELIFSHPRFHAICACAEFFGEVAYFTEWSRFLELSVICEKLTVYRMVSNDQISDGGVVHRTKREGPSTEP